MAYVSSSANRWYCGRETVFGVVPAITADQRIPAVKMTARQQKEKSTRKDKTGSRTWQGTPSGVRKQTSFDLSTYVRDWPDMTKLPSQGPLIEAAMGSFGALTSGGIADSGCTANVIRFAGAHNLTPGRAVTFGSEIRFISAIGDAKTVVLNAPFSVIPSQGALLGATANYGLAEVLPSVSIFDYWTPTTAAQRVISGAAVDQFTVQVNGDYHQFNFKGLAQDLVDSLSFQSGDSGLGAFPAEPAGASEFSYSIVPGNLGQVWMGATPTQFFTLADATVTIKNNLDLRANEFGSILPRAIAPGNREVTVTFELFQQDDAATAALYQAARQHLPLSMMFQLGQTAGQLTGIYLQSVIPDVPEFDDSDKRLKWKFRDTHVQGTADDEISIAFG